MAENTNNASEEVDLGKLFQLIGKGFGNLFKAIGGFLKDVLHFVILSLVFLKKNAIIIGVTTITGAVLGYGLESYKGSSYQSEMIINANFESAKVLYPKIDMIKNLIKVNNTSELSKIFNISKTEAGSLRKFTIEPYNKNEQLLNNYDDYIKSTDTIYTKDYTLEMYLKRKQDVDLYTHIIKVTAKDVNVFPKLTSSIKSLVENDHFKTQFTEKQKELALTEQEIKRDLKNLDTLRVRYNEVARMEAMKNNNTASLNLSTSSEDNTEKNYDLDVLKLNSTLVEKLNTLNKEKVKYNSIIKVILSFQPGTNIELIKTPLFMGSVLGFLFSILVILGIRLNKYLDTYLVVKNQ